MLGWPIDRGLVWFFGVFNGGFRLATRGYSFVVSLFLRGSLAALILYVGLLYLTYDTFTKTPAGFIPTQDMGYLLANVQLPDSVSLERTKATLDRCEKIARDTPGIRFTQAITGQSLLLSANGSNFGSMFCIFDPVRPASRPASQRVRTRVPGGPQGAVRPARRGGEQPRRRSPTGRSGLSSARSARPCSCGRSTAKA